MNDLRISRDQVTAKRVMLSMSKIRINDDTKISGVVTVMSEMSSMQCCCEEVNSQTHSSKVVVVDLSGRNPCY